MTVRFYIMAADTPRPLKWKPDQKCSAAVAVKDEVALREGVNDIVDDLLTTLGKDGDAAAPAPSPSPSPAPAHDEQNPPPVEAPPDNVDFGEWEA